MLDADHGAPSSDDPESPDGNAGGEGAASQRKRGGGAALLGAAMLAIGEILEPEKTTVEIVQTDDDPLDDLPFTLDFGTLPPLE